MAPDLLRRLLEMRLQHAEIGQVRLPQQQIGQAGRHIVAFEWTGQAKPRDLGQRRNRAE